MKKLLIFSFLLAFSLRLMAQSNRPVDLNVNQHFTFNPGKTAIGNYLETNLIYRKQWAGFENAPEAFSVTIQYPFTNQNMALGGYFQSNQQGLLNHFILGFAYAYKLKTDFFDDDILSMGIGLELSQFNFDQGKLLVNEIEDPTLSDLNERSYHPDVNFGVYYTSAANQYEDNYFNIGLSASQFLDDDLLKNEAGTNIYTNRLQTHFTASISGGIHFDQFIMVPQIVYSTRKNDADYALLNIKFENKRKYWGLVAIDNASVLGFQAGVFISTNAATGDYLRIGVGSNYNIGILQDFVNSDLELVMSYLFAY